MRVFLLLALCTGLAPIGSAQLPADFEKQVDTVCKDWSKPNAPGGLVGVAIDGKLVFAKGYGLANLETQTPNTADTVMDVGSVSKQITAMCILLLEEQGKLSTSDEFTKYVPEVPTFGQKITIGHLLHMTSGLRDYLTLWAAAGYNFVDLKSFQDAIDVMAKQTGANSVPGEKWNYCNAGYMLMAVIVERVSGESLAKFAKKNVFEPLGMDHTQFVDDDNVVIQNRATSYTPGPGGTYLGLFSFLGTYGDGGLHTTLADFTKWHENFYANKLGKKDQKLVETMVTVSKLNDGKPTTYGCGLEIDNLHGTKRIQHGGNWLGFNAMTARFPEKHVSVFTFGNDGTNLSSPFNDKIAEIVLGNAPKVAERKEIKLAEQALKALPGTFSLPDGRIATVTLEGSQLSAQLTGQPKYPVFPESDTTFFFKVADAQLEFVKDSGGQVTSAKIHQGGRIIDLKKGEPFKPSEDQIKALLGHYKCFEIDFEADIVREGDKLYFMQSDGRAELSLLSADRATARGISLTAVRDATGVVRCLTLDMGRASGMKFIKH